MKEKGKVCVCSRRYPPVESSVTVVRFMRRHNKLCTHPTRVPVESGQGAM